MEALAGQASEQTGVFFMADIRLTIGCVDALVSNKLFVEFGQIAMEGRVPPKCGLLCASYSEWLSYMYLMHCCSLCEHHDTHFSLR